ncbi:MAG: IS4 family transposase [Dolichospermum sp. BR01]|nr:IS4 family transposase [Dolichospermum sp. BR01]MBS9384075.1 IS4 family transposase [Dolichospermum sp. BR01]MBS9385103.1 IS4 family transposase [Dolichospermum sp. BR01]MBS9385629.1 IS4 family transposase [Dolichospermum sp. BR01]
MLPVFHQTYLETEFSTREYLFLKIIITVLQSVQNIALESLAAQLPIPILFESRRKKIQRFLSLPNLSIEKVWLPIVRGWLEETFTAKSVVYLVIDRTTWANINLFMVSVVWEKRSFPVYFQLLPKLGSSNFEEQRRILSHVLPIFEIYKICVLGDREFCSIVLANWLREQKAYFCLRLKNNHFVKIKKDVYIELKNLGLSPGVSLFLEGVKVTKSHGFDDFNIAGKWKGKVKGIAPKEPWFILTNLDTLEQAVSAYKKRFCIEEMFRDFKKGGYYLEGTQVRGNRLIALIILIAIAYTTATIKGQQIKRKGSQKYVGRVKEFGRYERRHSTFYIGLYGSDWVNFTTSCWDLILELLKLIPNKRKYHQRGLRAMELMLSSS